MHPNKPSLVLHSKISVSAKIHANLTNVGIDVVDDFCLCFSLLAPLKALQNCIIEDVNGGFVRLRPDQNRQLRPGESWAFSFAYDQQHDEVNADNIAFGPQAAYIEMGDQVYAVNTQPMRFEHVKPKKQEYTTTKASELTVSSLQLIPAPSSWRPSNGHCKAENRFTPIKEGSAVNAWHAVQNLNKRLNLNSFASDNHQSDIAIPINILPLESTTEDAYELCIEASAISLRAKSESGYFYGLVSLLQLHFNYSGHLPCGLIIDQPRFEWRGQHLDCARQFFKVADILQLLDLMALLKLNRFHWHAINDEAFRFELESAPQLMRTAWRGHQQWLPGVFGAGIGAKGGFYSKADMQHVVQHARELHIDVMAEISIPGHALALIHGLPQLHNANDSDANIRSVQGYRNNTINPGLSTSLTTLEPILAELCNLFPTAPLHLGGDEVPLGVWDNSAAVTELKQKYHLESQEDVQGWFMHQLATKIKAQGGCTAAWEEAASGQHDGIGIQTLLFAWRSLESGHALAREGKKVVLCPAQHTYLDMSLGIHSQSYGANWAGDLPLENTTNWQPVPPDEPELEKQIKGIQGALWSESVFDTDMLQKTLAPRILGIAEVAWSSDKNKRQGIALYQAAKSFYPLFKAIEWQFTHV